jgi:hypothetical protein
MLSLKFDLANCRYQVGNHGARKSASSTNAAYVPGCVCRERREHQRIRMVRNRVNAALKQHRRHRSDRGRASAISG